MSALEASDHTRAFARRVGEIELCARDLTRLTDLLMDHVGVVLGGARYAWVASLLDWAARYAGSGQAQLVSRGMGVAPEVAALVNGVAGHSFELDDTHDASMSHPGAVAFPVALAVGAEAGASGRAVLTAVAVGYETMARLGEAAGAARVIAAGFHPTALFGVFGAAATAARLMRLDEAGLLRAWGHALSLAGGSMAFSQAAEGADVKRMHAGYAARNGVLAAEMARVGISAPARSLDGSYGFLELFGQDARPELLAGPPEARAIHEVSLKPYACNRLLHSMIDGLRDLTDFDLRFEQVARLVVRGPEKLVRQHVVRRPASTMAAQYSLPFTLGAVLVFGPDDANAFHEGNLARPDVLAWADLVEVETCPALERQFPERFGTEVEIVFKDGEIRRRRILDSLGTARRPMSPHAIRAKARGLVCAAWSERTFKRLAGAVDGFAASADICDLQRALAAQD